MTEQPLMVSAKSVGRLLDVSKSTIHRMDSAGKIPSPTKLSGGTVRWSYPELVAWCEAGCPTREVWDASRHPMQR